MNLTPNLKRKNNQIQASDPQLKTTVNFKKRNINGNPNSKDMDDEPPTNPSELSPLEDEEDNEHFIDLGVKTIPAPYDSGSYMGPSNAEDPYLTKFMTPRGDSGIIPFVTRAVRVVNEDVAFAVYSRSCECDNIIMSAYKTKWELLEKTVAPFRDELLALYLRFIDWTYPAVDKKRFYRAYIHNDPPLHRGVLCAMLGLGSTYWKYSAKLCVKRIPTDLAKDLWAMCLHYIEHDINCTGASLDTIQALLLYTQKRMIGDEIHEQVSGRVHIGKIVSLAFSLGLHLDCSEWQISDIEKESRRRLWALVFYADKWSAANLGQPSLLSNNVEGSQNHVFESQWPKERRFVQLVRLTNILSSVLDDLYCNSHPDTSIKTIMEANNIAQKAQCHLLELKRWREELPEDLREMSAKNELKYCSNGMTHLSALTVEVLIFRILLQPCYNGKYRHEAKELVQRIIIFCFEITHAHLHAFWISNCRLSLSTLVHFVLRYHAQTPVVERKKNISHMRSWLECLRSLSHAWEEGIGLAYQRIDALFHKGQTSLSLPLTDESFLESNIDGNESNPDNLSRDIQLSPEEELLALDEDFNFGSDSDSGAHGMLFFNDNLHDILHDILWD